MFITAGLPEEDPLLAGLQGVDTVIEHFIKNAQGKLIHHCIFICLHVYLLVLLLILVCFYFMII